MELRYEKQSQYIRFTIFKLYTIYTFAEFPHLNERHAQAVVLKKERRGGFKASIFVLTAVLRTII